MDLQGVDWVRLSFVDVFGKSHSIQLPASRFEAVAASGEPFDGSTLEGRARLVETDMRLLPDPSSLALMSEGIARAVCTVSSADGSPWAGDPRTALALVLEELGDLGSEYKVGAELEFYLIGDDGEPVDAGGYFDDAEDIGIRIARDAGAKLASLGVGVDSIHHEAGPGQYEIDLSAVSAMKLADSITLAKQVIREAAADSECLATFMPRPLPDEAGSGMHLHQRVSDRLVGGDGKLTDDGAAFLAGQLAHARGLSALGSPTVNSYKRLHSGPEAPSAIIWAHQNRGALVRVSPNMAGGATIEYRGTDPSANPYLVLAGLLVSAAHGLGAGLELAAAFEEESDGFDPASLDSARFEVLPRDLDEALDALLADDVLVDAFDRHLLSRLVDGRRVEASEYRSQVTPWEVDRYLEEA